ncbi:NAD(P)/FAD-dependent oxidoreductase [Hyphobacterium sp.]|uniref:NAD(P)/FAD-dependent oxidoreductase n=1 Tax=Hyphobacterium sp. TaxID=2004662 RepID=UPI003BAAC7ED
MSDQIVIIGAGQAGVQLADSLRREGHEGPVTLVGAETQPPYQRPPLSKGFLLDQIEESRLPLRPDAFYQQRRITTRFGTRATAIDRSAKTVTLETGDTLPYDKLALCLGAKVRIPPIPGIDKPHVLALRTLDDSLRLKSALANARSVAVIGGGFIGLEVAASARKLGRDVTIIEALDRVMKRAVSEPVSRFFEDLHRTHGSTLRLETQTKAITDDGIRLADASVITADLVVLGTGVTPEVGLAETAGLKCDNGIVVDTYGRTSDPDIAALGDCAQHPNHLTGEALRLESVQNAIDAAKAVAKTFTGSPEPYTAVPWFWSDQFDIKLQMAGLSQNTDTAVTRGDPASRSFSIFYFRLGQLMAADSINAPADHMAARRILANENRSIKPQDAADPEYDLRTAF